MSIKSKVVLMVGASSGFGKATAEMLLELGCIVYATSRSVEKMQDLLIQKAHLLGLDVTDNASIIASVEQILAEQGRIDVVFVNAGYGAYGTIESIAIEEIQNQYDVNVFGVARVLKAVLPAMRQQKSGRIIFTASLASHLSIACTGWYASTKHAITGIARALRQEVRDLGIEVIIIEPGIVKTGFDRVAFDLLDHVEHPADYLPLVDDFRHSMATSYAKAPGVDSTVKAMVAAAIAKRPKTVYCTTVDAKVLKFLQGVLSDRIVDWLILFWLKQASRKH
ncbi:SDR family NAD(P)-dependent oxidoreductase [Leptolyngbyaceae cyanobacterium CCMR0082]|uniref:SDR family NAD(P)-dependent oxidoreductase n=2 Tax=Adonisia turfae TaxID=2950184 RepID=A0A6M0S9C9_9CYAN|nr:SDR family NAD(P)-dependent oxidoreductase [Leptothoe sp. LEGE 181152]NEZ57450.1 SDR family NAD(P)-dependent oxidoreductase [Adonisia turfae CCMR0081]NEZ64916.1 SDR family NAD(P)-dependent oxidoreductase [Adonisia turfae CCMR0082]